METNKINWKNDYRYSESLHSSVEGLIGVYARLLRKYPDHADATVWQKEKAFWPDYKFQLKDMFFETEEIAVKEANRVSGILTKALNQEKELDLKLKSPSFKLK